MRAASPDIRRRGRHGSAIRLGILATHPVQYHSPWFRHLATRFDLEVLYVHRQSRAGQARAGFGVEFDWDIPLLDGYAHRWLENVSRRPALGSFWGCDTPEIGDVVEERAYDAFLVFGWSYRSAIQAVRACWRRGVPVFMRGDSQLPTARPAWRTALKYPAYRWFLPRIDAHLYVGQRNREYLRHYGVPERRLVSAPHFVDNDFFRRGAEEARAAGRTGALRHELGIPSGAFVVLFVGKLIEKKRPGDFVRALALAAAGGAGGGRLHGLIVGDGPLRESLEELARSERTPVTFAGFHNQSELPSCYGAADAIALTSDARETWGLVVNEAMACGLPAVVSAAVGCAPDLIEEGRTGYTYPAGDVAALGDRMRRLCGLGDGDRERVRVVVRERIDRHSIREATLGLERALDAVLGGSHS